MAEITLTLNDGRSIQFEKGASVKEVLDQLGVKMDKSVFSAIPLRSFLDFRFGSSWTLVGFGG